MQLNYKWLGRKEISASASFVAVVMVNRSVRFMRNVSHCYVPAAGVHDMYASRIVRPMLYAVVGASLKNVGDFFKRFPHLFGQMAVVVPVAG